MQITLFLILGLGALSLGADWLVRGASSLAGRLGISPLVVGLTVVAFGTSAPELAVSTKAALSGQGALSLGNVVGSNIFNVLFILGLSALIVPLRVSLQVIRSEVPIMIFVSVVVLLFCLTGELTRSAGVVLFLGIIVYTVVQILLARREGKAAEPGDGAAPRLSIGMALFFGVIGLALLVLGSRWFVWGAVELARGWGVSELVIGLTIVAAGTSLPEVATSVMAGIKGERDIAVGNVVGSNIFNILSVLGAAALFSPLPIPIEKDLIQADLPMMLAVAVCCLPIFVSGGTISRSEGGLFIGWYAVYTIYLVLRAQESAMLESFTAVIMWLMLPATAAVMALSFVRWERESLEKLAADVMEQGGRPLALVKRVVILIAGGSVVLAGVVMLITPGPGIVGIAAGLAILSTEFLWARRLLQQFRTRFESALGKKPDKKP